MFNFNFFLFFIRLAISNGCLPPTGYFPGHYPTLYSGFGYGGYNKEKFADPTHSQVESAASVPVQVEAEANNDVITTASSLNCKQFDGSCRWSNTNEDEFDWGVRMSTPEAERWIPSLSSAFLPGPGSAVLISAHSNGWEAGKLVSDQIPCMTSPLQLTATAWASRAKSSYERPNLQLCSHNIQSERHISTCVRFPVENGVPVTINVPIPKDPLSSTQLIFLGDNFISMEGGAIFLQDISVSGEIEPDCSLIALDSRFNDDDGNARKPLRKTKLKWNHSRKALAPLPEYKSNSRIHLQGLSEFLSKTLVETCMILSCNPAEAKCLWRSGSEGWKPSMAQRTSNPLTGVQSPPKNSMEFLVAPLDNRSRKYKMTSSKINVPTENFPIYFCFYEYFATDGARLAICIDTDGQNCFYSRTDISVGDRLKDNRRWNMKCVRLPSGSYEVNVLAENRGMNQGEIGFLPLKITSDPDGNDPLC